jgi:WD40 repeat protein
MRWSHGGERYAAGGTGGLLTVWDDATGEVVAALDSSSDVYSFDFTVEGNGLVTGDSDAVLLHWSIADQRVIRQFNEGFRGKITHVGISETGAIIASRSSEKMIRLWSPGIDRPLAEMTSDDEVRTFRLAPSARHLALWQERQHTGVWTHLPDNPTFVPLSEEEDLVGIEFAHHTEQVFGLYYNYGFWNINDGVLERDYYFHERNREILALSPDDQFVAMPGDYEPLILFRLGDEDKIWKSDADIPYTGAIKFSHDGNDIAVNGKYGVHLIDAATGIERWKADQPERYWHYFPTFSLDGRFVLGGGRGKVHIWSRTDGEPLHTIQVPDSEFAYGLTAVADNAKRFAVGFADGSVELWRILALPRPADLNCDDCVDFNDIDPFVLALSGEDAYQKAFPNCRWLNADLDNDGAVDLDDVDPFVALLAEGQ